MATLTVEHVLGTPALRAAGPRVVAGGSGLDQRVRWVHTTELDDIAPLLREGDLLLSTGIAMPDTADGLSRFAASLAESGVVGLIVELGRRWNTIPAALVDACDELALPLVSLAREVPFAAVAQSVGERIVAEQLDQLRAAQRVHDTFTELSISEAGPEAILEAAQRLSGGAVVLESEQHQVLDYRAGPDDIGALLADWTTVSRAVVMDGRTAWDEANGWLVTRVGRRERGWGRLAMQLSGSPSEETRAIAERAAAALALHRLHDRQRDSAIRRVHHELMVGLLTNPSSPDLLRRCELAGLPTTRRQFVGVSLQVQFDNDQPPTTSAARLEEVIAATVHAAHDLNTPALVCEMDRNVRALLSFAPSANSHRTVDQLAALVQRRQTVIVGAGRPIARTAEIDRTLRESLHVVQSVRDPEGGPPVHRLADVHLRGLLAMLGDDDRLRLFVDRELSPLRQQERDGSRDLLATVRALITHPTSKTEAAASLHLSRPAFYDRLARVERLLGASLDDPDIRASLHVAILAEEIVGFATP